MRKRQYYRDGASRSLRRSWSPRADRARTQLERTAPRAASSSSVQSGSSGGVRDDQRRRLDVRRPDLPAVGLDAQGPGPDASTTNAVGSGAGVAAAAVGHGRLRRQRPGADARRGHGAAKGPAVQFPIALRRDHRLLQPVGRQERPQARRPDARRHLPRQDQDLERPGDQGAEPGRRACPSTTITVVHRSDSSGTTKGFTTFLSDYSPAWTSGRRRPTRPSSGRPAPAPRATTASPPRSSRPPARSATSSRPTRCRTTSRTPSVKNKSGKFVAPTLDVDLGGGRGHQGPAGPGDLARSTRPNPAAYPIASQTFVIVYKDMCKAGHQPGRGAAA